MGGEQTFPAEDTSLGLPNPLKTSLQGTLCLLSQYLTPSDLKSKGFSQLAPNPNQAFALRLASPALHQRQPFHLQAKLGTASSPREALQGLS